MKFNLYFTADIRGSATFIQIDPTKDLSIQVTGLHGLKSGKHGFHIHENGDCSDPGAHFNPEMVNVLKNPSIIGYVCSQACNRGLDFSNVAKGSLNRLKSIFMK